MENKTNKRRLTPIETLDAYKAFCDFRKYMYQAIEKFPKWIKHSEGAACIASIKDCVRFLSVIARTYDEKVKLNYIDAFLAEWDVVSDSVLFFFDVKCVSSHTCAVMLKMKDEVEAQLTALRRHWLENAKGEGGAE